MEGVAASLTDPVTDGAAVVAGAVAVFVPGGPSPIASPIELPMAVPMAFATVPNTPVGAAAGACDDGEAETAVAGETLVSP